MPFHDEPMEYDKIEAIHFQYPLLLNIVSRDHDDSSRLCKIVSNMKKLRLLIVSLPKDTYENAEGVSFLTNELRDIEWSRYPPTPFPHSFQPLKLVVLKLVESMQKEVWRGYKHLPSLRVLELRDMKKLLSTPDFDGLPRLQKLTLEFCEKLEEIHPSLGSHTSLEYLKVSSCHKLKRIPTMSQMKNISTLLITWCSLKDGEIPSGIGVLSNLQKLDLSYNSFSRLDFSLSELTRLKCLNVSNCYMLLELPELPSSLAILTAHSCWSLTIVEDFNKDCKELCQVSLNNYGWSDNLLQSMLKGNTIEDSCMNLYLEFLEISKVFKPPLLRGSSCRLELPENWSNDFSGFLICAIISHYNSIQFSTTLSVKQVFSGMDFEDDVVLDESDGDSGNYATQVWYVSFGSLRRTTWWDQTYKSLYFNIEGYRREDCIGFGVRLVEEKSTSGGLTEASTISSSPYTPKFLITHDSSSELRAELVPYE